MDILKKELHASINYFLETTRRGKKNFGLIKDTFPSSSEASSIAGSGYFLSSLILASEEKLLDKEDLKMMAIKALKFYESLDKIDGMFYHFYNISTGKPMPKTEVSNIDSTILFLNMIAASEYFGGEVKTISNRIIENANFLSYVNPKNNLLYMAIDNSGKYYGVWDRYAEQLMLYIIGAGIENKNHQLSDKEYYAFIRDKGEYQGLSYIYSWVGSLFTYQFSHLFIDFKNLVDRNGDNWYKNTKNATKADYLYCRGKSEYNNNYFGLSAALSCHGYECLFGAGLRGAKELNNDGTIATYATISSLSFLPEETIKAIDDMDKIIQLNGPYGLFDSFNIKNNWYANKYIAIDKGASMIAIANYLNDTIYKLVMKSEIIQRGLQRLGFKKEDN